MSSAISNALSGLQANSTAINIVSTNLANLSTTGYKATEVDFEDLVNQNIGGFTPSGGVTGSTTVKNIQQFTQGTLLSTGNPFDAAIQGNGFFVLRNSEGQQTFTRQGNFTIDATGHLVTQSGQFVQGWNQSNGVLITNGATSDIVLPTGLGVPPTATTQFSLSVNLASDVAVGSQAASFSSPIKVIDSEGNSHTLTVAYTETATNTWSYAVTVPSSDLAAGGASATTTLTSGTLTFDGNGNLLTPAAANGAVSLSMTGLANGAKDMNLTWNLYDNAGNPLISQNTPTSANLTDSQNGFAAGQLNGLSIGANGAVIAKYSNGATVNVAQMGLASVENPDSMVQVDANSWVPSASTAVPVIGVPGTGPRGQVQGGAVESSTVDIATEFTNLLSYERGYQAASKVITTEDQVEQQTIQLIPSA